MLSKRLIVCLDVRDGLVTKGVKFKNNVDLGDPVAMAKKYYEQGVDELVFYDITASSDRRDIIIEVVKKVADEIFIPFSVGGGIRTLEDMRGVLLAGAEKISVNSAAVENPEIIRIGAELFGSQCIVLGMDVIKRPSSLIFSSGYEVMVNGGRVSTGLDALEWAKNGEFLGAGEICLNSIDADGTKDGYELVITSLISENVGIPVIASGGAGNPEHVSDVLTKGKADAALVASIVHYDEYSIKEIKEHMIRKGIKTRQIYGR
ncbi:MAG: imidazole glycerol phosphate synthase subunit HisF [Elusimicrobiota bacterium]